MNFKIGLFVIALMLIVQANVGFSFESDHSKSNGTIMSKRGSKIEEYLKSHEKKARMRFHNVGKRSMDMH